MDGRNPQCLVDNLYNHFLPSFSADGKWVVYSSTDSGNGALWKAPISGGAPLQVIDKPSLSASVSPDGRRIACSVYDEIAGDGSLKLAVLPFEGRDPTVSFDIPLTADLRQIHWKPDGSAVMFGDTENGIWSQAIEGGSPTKLADFKSDLIFSFAWSAGGQQLAVARGRTTSDVVLINNFR